LPGDDGIDDPAGRGGRIGVVVVGQLVAGSVEEPQVGVGAILRRGAGLDNYAAGGRGDETVQVHVAGTDNQAAVLADIAADRLADGDVLNGRRIARNGVVAQRDERG